MGLIVTQIPVDRLPAGLAQSAAFVKQVDFDPVHESPVTDQPAEKIHGGASQYDTLTLSERAQEQLRAHRDRVVDITDPEAAKRRAQGDALGQAMRSWNATVAQLKQESERSAAYGYARFQASLQASDPAVYSAWMRIFGR